MTIFQSVTPNLRVQDIERSSTFYRDVLGFSIKQTVPDEARFAFTSSLSPSALASAGVVH